MISPEDSSRELEDLVEEELPLLDAEYDLTPLDPEPDYQDVLGLIYHKQDNLNKWVVTAAHVFSNGEASIEVWGPFQTKTDADVYIELNKPSLLLYGENLQVRELRPVDDGTLP